MAEYRRVVKSGPIVFENEVVDDHPFAFFTPFLMPYKLTGISLYDLVEDLQRIQTAINRQYLDNLYLANTPMRGVVEGMVTLDDLLNPRPGGIVRMKGTQVIQDLTVPDTVQNLATQNLLSEIGHGIGLPAIADSGLLGRLTTPVSKVYGLFGIPD